MDEKIIISIVGATNVGKSTLFNLLTGQKNKSIVDKKSGTTADNVISLMEIHDLGKVKIIDTAGIDESGILGAKKRKNTKNTILKSDLILFILRNDKEKLIKYEKTFLDFIILNNKQALILINNFNSKSFSFSIPYKIKHLCINFNSKVENQQLKISNFIINNFKQKQINNFNPFKQYNVFNKYVLLIIPLDEESPKNRLIKPQNIIIEELLKQNAMPILYRPNLNNFDEVHFNKTIEDLSKTKWKLSLIITDSQAINIISKYIPKNIQLTTFSILLTQYMNDGNIEKMKENVKILDKLENNDKILIIEACNHDRKCNDIATKQLPTNIINFTGKNLKFDFHFGRTFLSEKQLKKNKYKLIIMCGGCMLDKQDYKARITLINKLNIPITNYGFIFKYTSKT